MVLLYFAPRVLILVLQVETYFSVFKIQKTNNIEIEHDSFAPLSYYACEMYGF